MKKYIFMAVAGMLALSSCSNDENDIQDAKNAPRQMTFTAGYNEGGETRASLDGSTKKVTFDAGDVISILSVNNTNTQFTTSAGGASATFSGTATDDSKFYAVYPYTADLTLDGTTIKNVEIPSHQDCRFTTWDPRAAIAYATTTGSSLQFYNACALLKITNDSGDETNISISLHGSSVYPTGKFDLDTSTGTLTVQEDEGRPMVATSVKNNNTTIYLAIAPGTYDMLMAQYYNPTADTDGSKMKMDPMNPITFEAGKIYYLGKTSEWTTD